MIKTIKMLNVREDIKVSIIVNENTISVKDKNNKQLYVNTVEEGNNEQINTIISTLINKHFEKGYVIMSMDIFDIKLEELKKDHQEGYCNSYKIINE